MGTQMLAIRSAQQKQLEPYGIAEVARRKP
jgi:hypothetical protein